MVANILSVDPYPTHPKTMGSKGQNSTFSQHGHVAYQIKDNHECSKVVANILPEDPPTPTLGMWSVDQKLTLTEHGHVAHQIKKNLECSNMVANILPSDPHTPTPSPKDWVFR